MNLSPVIRMIGRTMLGFAAFSAVVIGAQFALNDAPPDFAALAAPAGFLAVGLAALIGGRRLAAKGEVELGVIGFWVFTTFGAVAALGGAALTFTDPAGIALILFGAVFIGAGWVARRLFAAPEGRNTVVVEEWSADTSAATGLSSETRTETVITVPKGAEDGAEAVVGAWRDERLKERPGWASGRIEPNRIGAGAGFLTAGAVMAAVVFCVFLAIGYFVEGVFLFVAVGPLIFACAFCWLAIQRRARERKFGRSVLTLEHGPPAPGGRLIARLEVEAPRQAFEDGRFLLRLTCLKSAAYSGGDGGEHVATDWSEEKKAIASGESRLSVAVAFALPGDLPPATLGAPAGTGVRWELRVAAEAPGVDYVEFFDLPVLAPAES